MVRLGIGALCAPRLGREAALGPQVAVEGGSGGFLAFLFMEEN